MPRIPVSLLDELLLKAGIESGVAVPNAPPPRVLRSGPPVEPLPPLPTQLGMDIPRSIGPLGLDFDAEGMPIVGGRMPLRGDFNLPPESALPPPLGVDLPLPPPQSTIRRGRAIPRQPTIQRLRSDSVDFLQHGGNTRLGMDQADETLPISEIADPTAELLARVRATQGEDEAAKLFNRPAPGVIPGSGMEEALGPHRANPDILEQITALQNKMGADQYVRFQDDLLNNPAPESANAMSALLEDALALAGNGAEGRRAARRDVSPVPVEDINPESIPFPSEQPPKMGLPTAFSGDAPRVVRSKNEDPDVKGTHYVMPDVRFPAEQQELTNQLLRAGVLPDEIPGNRELQGSVYRTRMNVDPESIPTDPRLSGARESGRVVGDPVFDATPFPRVDANVGDFVVLPDGRRGKLVAVNSGVDTRLSRRDQRDVDRLAELGRMDANFNRTEDLVRPAGQRQLELSAYTQKGKTLTAGRLNKLAEVLPTEVMTQIRQIEAELQRLRGSGDPKLISSLEAERDDLLRQHGELPVGKGVVAGRAAGAPATYRVELPDGTVVSATKLRSDGPSKATGPRGMVDKPAPTTPPVPPAKSAGVGEFEYRADPRKRPAESINPRAAAQAFPDLAGGLTSKDKTTYRAAQKSALDRVMAKLGEGAQLDPNAAFAQQINGVELRKILAPNRITTKKLGKIDTAPGTRVELDLPNLSPDGEFAGEWPASAPLPRPGMKVVVNGTPATVARISAGPPKPEAKAARFLRVLFHEEGPGGPSPLRFGPGAPKKILAGAGLAAAASLGAPDDSESATLPRITGIARDLLDQQGAKIIKGRNMGLGDQAKTTISNTLHPIESFGTAQEKAGLQLDPEKNVRNIIPNLVRGQIEPRMKPHLNALSAATGLVGKENQELLSAYLMLGGFDRELRVVRGKAADIASRVAGLEKAGKFEEANALRRANAEITTRLKDKTVVPGGMDEGMVQAELAKLEADNPAVMPQVKAAAKQIYSMTRELLDKAHKEGLITPEAYREYTSRGDDYIPMYRLMEAFDNVLNQRVKFDADPQAAMRPAGKLSLLDENVISREMIGSSRTPENPLVNIVKYIEGVQHELTRNEAARVILPELERDGAKLDPALWGAKKLTDPNATLTPGRARVAFMQKGKPVYYEVSNEVAKAMQLEDAESLRASLKGFRVAKRLFQTAAATYNPGFMAKQAFVDPMAAMILPNYQKYDKTNRITSVALPFAKAWVHALGHQWKLLGAPKQWAEMQELGVAGRPLTSRVDPVVEALGLKAKMKNMGPGEKALTVVERGLEGVQHAVLDPIERSTKYASYSTLRKKGFGPQEAARETRKFGGSPDFMQFGYATKRGQDYIMFLNPAVQGTARVFEAAKTHPADMAKALGVFGMAMGATMLRNQSVVDENGVSELSKIPWEDRMTALHVVLNPDEELDAALLDAFPGLKPEIRSTGTTSYARIKIPVAPEISMMLAPIFALYQAATREEYTAAQAMLDSVEGMIPGGGALKADDPLGSVGRRATASLNPVLRFPIESAMDKYALSDTPIVGSRVSNNLPEFQYTRRTTPTARAIAKLLPEGYDSPDRVDHAIKTFLPGIAGQLLRGAAEFSGAAAADPNESALKSGLENTLDQPVVGEVLRRFIDPGIIDQTKRDAANKVYGARNEAASAASTLSTLANTEPETLESLLQTAKGEALMRQGAANRPLGKITDGLSKISKAKDMIIRSTDLSAQEKKQQLQELARTEKELLRAAAGAVLQFRQEGILPR